MVFFRDDDDEAGEETPTTTSSERRAIPLLPLRDIVVFPNMVVPLFVGRPKSIRALEEGSECILVLPIIRCVGLQFLISSSMP